MPKTLTTERKAQLKKAVLDSIDGKPVEPVAAKTAKPAAKPVRKVVAKPAAATVTADAAKAPVRKVSTAKPSVKSATRKTATKSKAANSVVPASPMVDKIRQSNNAGESAASSAVKSASIAKTAKAKSGSSWDDDFFNSPTSARIPAVKEKSAKPVSSKRSGRGWKIALITVIIVILAAAAFDVFAIYRLGWRDQVSRKVAEILPLPALSVNGQTIPVSAYLQDMDILEYALDSGRDGLATSISSDNKTTILDRLVEMAVTKSELAKYGKSVSAEDLDKAMSALVEQFGGQEAAAQAVKEFYGITLDQFKLKVLAPLMDKDLLQSLVVNDDSISVTQEAKQKADDVLKLALQPEVSFAELARQYTDDEAGVDTGGDVGYVNQGDLPEDLEKALFALPDGGIYNQVVKLGSGYHVFQVENKLVDNDSGKQSIKLRQVFIKVDIDKHIKQLVESANVMKYVK